MNSPSLYMHIERAELPTTHIGRPAHVDFRIKLVKKIINANENSFLNFV